jgi:5'-3' exonuclease, N-terminal resolvase-like domain
MYNNIIFDSVNTGYLVFNNTQHLKENMAEVITFQDKRVYRFFLKNFIETVEMLKQRYLAPEGQLIFLFDNYESRDELNRLLQPLKESDNRRKVNKEYKSTRIRQKMEFYNTLDVVRYYYLIQSKEYHTAQIPNLEADDLVPRCLEKCEGTTLLVSNDSDWCRYMNDSIHTLPDIYWTPLDKQGFIEKNGYEPTEGKIILNKILWGDQADNIQAVFPDLKPEVKQYIVEQFDDVQDFMLNANSHTLLSPFVITIKDREAEIKLAYQMLVAIPVSEAHFNAIFTTGRNSETMLKTMHTKIYGEDPDVFQFGVETPRVDP